jgi:uncharacterized membrane protein YeaQ/YmgE (transglycosylase-associated protein family)
MKDLFVAYHLRALLALLAVGLSFSHLTCFRAQGADGVGEKVGAVTSEAGKQIQDAGQAAETKIQQLWRRIDEQRLKNRTPDQIVAWIIMGLLVGGLIHQISKFNKLVTLLLGLAGAFVGGIIANLTQIDLGLGPVLIRYEDLLASLIGGLLIVFGARFLGRKKTPK